MKPSLPPAREAEILELSEDVANEDSSSGRVCPSRVCTRKGIVVLHEGYGSGTFDGVLVYQEGDWVILCNSDNGNTPGSTRERFTIAHELGHYHIPEHRRLLMAGRTPHGSCVGVFDGAANVQELEADTFAANLLMPSERFRSRLQVLKKPPLESIVQLRKEFDASLESTAIQTMRHTSSVVAMAKWDDDKLAWHRISDCFFRETGYRQFKLRGRDLLPHDCATALALADPASQTDSPIRETVLTAAFCFGHVAAGGKRDALLREQSVRNGRYGVLSVYSTLDGK